MPATRKLVALSLADQANDEGVCWPSARSLSERCGLVERSIYGALDALEAAGFMTIERRSGKPNIYHLTPATDSGVKTKNRRKTPAADSVVPLQQIHGLAGETPAPNAGVTPATDSPLQQMHPCTTFSTPLHQMQGTPAPNAGGISTVIEPSRTVNKKYKPPKFAERPSDVDEKVWSDFLELRKSKRAPLTETALDGIRSESGRAGQTLNATLRLCCNRGWQGFNADWLRERTGNGQSRLTEQDIAEALAEGDRRRAQEAHR